MLSLSLVVMLGFAQSVTFWLYCRTARRCIIHATVSTLTDEVSILPVRGAGPSAIVVTILSGKPGSLSHDAPLRLTQMVLKPKAPARKCPSCLTRRNYVTGVVTKVFGNEPINSWCWLVAFKGVNTEQSIKVLIDTGGFGSRLKHVWRSV